MNLLRLPEEGLAVATRHGSEGKTKGEEVAMLPLLGYRRSVQLK